MPPESPFDAPGGPDPDAPGDAPQRPADTEAQPEGTSEPEGGDPTAEADGKRRDWAAFSFQHEKLKHLTTVGLVVAGGAITLFQSEMMTPTPVSMAALALPILSSMLTLAAQVSLGNEAGEGWGRERRDTHGVPVGVHWVQLAALLLLSAALGYLGYFFFRNIGLVA